VRVFLYLLTPIIGSMIFVSLQMLFWLYGWVFLYGIALVVYLATKDHGHFDDRLTDERMKLAFEEVVSWKEKE